MSAPVRPRPAMLLLAGTLLLLRSISSTEATRVSPPCEPAALSLLEVGSTDRHRLRRGGLPCPVDGGSSLQPPLLTGTILYPPRGEGAAPAVQWVQKFNVLRLLGIFSANRGSSVVNTSSDVSGDLFPGDLLLLGRENVDVKYGLASVSRAQRRNYRTSLVLAVGPQTVTLKQPFKYPSVVKVHGWKMLLTANSVIDRIREEARKKQLEELEELKKERAHVCDPACTRCESCVPSNDTVQGSASCAPLPCDGGCAVPGKRCICGQCVCDPPCTGGCTCTDSGCAFVCDPPCEPPQSCVNGTCTAECNPPCPPGRRCRAGVCEEACQPPCPPGVECQNGVCAATCTPPCVPPAVCLNGTCTDVDLGESPCNGQILSGTASVLRGSREVTTTVDVRAELGLGEAVQLRGLRFVVTEPRDALSFALSEVYYGPDATDVKICKLVPDLEDSGLTPLEGCLIVIHNSPIVRTEVDLRTQIATGEVIQIGNMQATVMTPRDQQMLTLSGPYPGPTSICVRGVRRSVEMDKGLMPLCGTVDAVHGDKTVITSCDLRNSISAGDAISIGSLASTYVASTPFTDLELTLDRPFEGDSVKGVKAYKKAREVPCPGTVSVVEGSDVVTTSEDLRNCLQPGDMVKVYQTPGSEDVFAVVAPQDMYTLTLARPHPGPTATGLKAYRVSGTLNPLSGAVSVAPGDKTIETTEDLTGELLPGDRVSVNGMEVTVTDPITPTSVALAAPFAGHACKGAPMFRMGKSAEQLTLEALAREKLKCKTLICMALIEQRERGLPFNYARNLKEGLILGNRAATDLEEEPGGSNDAAGSPLSSNDADRRQDANAARFAAAQADLGTLTTGRQTSRLGSRVPST